ncbi:MAG: hypothetical protein RBR45_15240 [Pseudomonas sp.]|jgi:hypothetical protein|nr:hypothetical protein [Pseudomonas sp.]
MFAEKKTMSKKREANIRSGKALRTFVLLPLLAALLLAQAPLQTLAQAAALPSPEKQALLQAQALLLWQQINQVRQNPRAALARLGITAEQASAALGDQSWILDEGLPPLAWNTALVFSAEQHGQDMADHLYYSYVSLDGRTVADRVAEVGVEARQADEALAILAFSSYVGLEEATRFMLDNLLRDELLAPAGSKRTLLSPELSEVGISLFAESLQLVMGQQYVYLLVADFAQPTENRSWLVGQLATGQQLAFCSRYTGFWELVPQFGAGLVQQQLPATGGTLYLLDAQGQAIASGFVYPRNGQNQQLPDNLTGFTQN